jgi:uncharacterized protein
MPTRLVAERGIVIPMRDGVKLSADIYRPEKDTSGPVLLQRTPYGKGFAGTSFALWAAENGYAVIIQDTRGRWSSEGDSYPFIYEKNDGYDTLEWISSQPWCSGKVGMFGESYLGYTQLAAASSGHPALAAIIPAFTFNNPQAFLYQGGAFNLGAALSWSLLAGAQMALMRLGDSGLLSPLEQISFTDQFIKLVDGLATGETFSYLPLSELPLVGKDGLFPLLADVLTRPSSDPFWQQIAVPVESIKIPALHIGGWYDVFIENTLADYIETSQLGNPHQKVVVGPWVHANIDGLAGEVDFGLQASAMLVLPDELQLRWFDYWLKGEQNGIMEEPTVRIFVMGSNTWRDEAEWPLSRAQITRWYLHSRGSANTIEGDGWLSQEPPQNEPPDVYLYDPRSPVPTRGGGLCCWSPALPAGAYDQRPVEQRPDVLVFTTPPFEASLEVTGPVELTLFASSSAPDTDFTAKLVDVGPCGFARNLVDGIIRARRKEGSSATAFLEAECVYEFKIDLGPTSNLFKSGHRLRLEVSSSNFPKYDRNPNNGGDTGLGRELQPAIQTVFHDPDHPSHLSLPIIRG